MTTQGGRTPSLQGTLFSDVLSDVPAVLHDFARAASRARSEDLTDFLPPTEGGRDSAVLVLFGMSQDQELDVLVIERAHDMRSHAGQPAFPGGAVDVSDGGPIAAALREAQEETGLDPTGVRVFGLLPDLFIPISDFVVTPVLGWWQSPSPVFARDPAEVASVHRIRLSEFADPSNRTRVRHPSGYIGYGFGVRGLMMWGFSAGIMSGILDLGGWTQLWDRRRMTDVDRP
jgi:8-oxo-dGTP pyrophosphatase MutT (NUDIX family)